jgi:glutamate-5-semialdehyde dehydrogenase
LGGGAGGGGGDVVDSVQHDNWSLEHVKSGLGVVGFVFEGRPNVFADATGVLAGGNTVAMRIGSDALGTARAIMEHALVPALKDAGLPEGAVSLVDTPSRAAGWALFSDRRLGLAVARGSGRAVAQLGAVARQNGIPVSLHGTGGAWIVAAETADAEDFRSAVRNSLDRKVCNTLNTACIVESRAEDLVPVFLDALLQAGKRLGANPKLHVTEGVRQRVPEEWFDPVPIARAAGEVLEPAAEVVGDDELGVEWEWEGSPEVTLTIVPHLEAAIAAFNAQSPRFGASLISDDAGEHELFFDRVDAPFIGNGMTRWVDGQYALNRPELGLSNWQFGRLFGRGGILSADSIFTIRARAHMDHRDVAR